MGGFKCLQNDPLSLSLLFHQYSFYTNVAWFFMGLLSLPSRVIPFIVIIPQMYPAHDYTWALHTMWFVQKSSS